MPIIDEYISVKEISNKYSTLSTKQIRNRIKKLIDFSNSALIMNGKKGRGGDYLIHYSLLQNLVKRKRRERNEKKNTQKIIYKNRNFSELFFLTNNWDFFGCVYINKDIDYNELTKFFVIYNIFYVIHRRKEKNHIHFAVKSYKCKSDLKQEISSIFQKKKISIDEIFLTNFNSDLKKKSLDYLLRRGEHSEKKDLIDWGCFY